MALLEVRELRTYFQGQRGTLRAVNGVSFSVEKGQTLGLVGESGCGKTMSCLSILRLTPPQSRIVGGQIIFEGEDLLKKSEKQMRELRGHRISMILQDPMSSLNPAFSIGAQVAEALQLHQRLAGQKLRTKTIEALKLVRIPSAETRLGDYPHQLSGGMRQRVVGAISLACAPSLLIADEPTTSLDVTTQTVYLDLLRDIQRETGLGMIFVTHDFGIVAKMCDFVAVMYAGRIVEKGAVREIFNNPRHPYTRALLDSVPKLETRTQRLVNIPGQPPSLYTQFTGCAFTVRCDCKDAKCRPEEFPPEVGLAEGHSLRCWQYA